MSAESARQFLVKIGDGATPETFITVAGMRATSMTLDRDTVDITNKGSAGWQEILAGAGVARMTVTGSGVFTDSSAERSLRQLMIDGQIANFQIVFGNGDRFEGAFAPASLDYSGDHDGERTYSLRLVSAGMISFAGAA